MQRRAGRRRLARYCVLLALRGDRPRGRELARLDDGFAIVQTRPRAPCADAVRDRTAQRRPNRHKLGRWDILDRGLLLPSPMAYAVVRPARTRRRPGARHFRRRDRLLAVRPEIARVARSRHPSGRFERRPTLHGRSDHGHRFRAGEGRAAVGDRRTRLRDQLPARSNTQRYAGFSSRPDGSSGSGSTATTRFCR